MYYCNLNFFLAYVYDLPWSRPELNWGDCVFHPFDQY